MTVRLRVTAATVDQERICIHAWSQDPYDCSQHDHVNGARRVRVEVVHESGDEAEVMALVGKIVTRETA